MRKLIFLLSLLALSPSAALAESPAVRRLVPNAQIVGQGRLSVLFWDVYDATLYAPQGKWEAEKPYALSIDYFREIEGTDIADRSAQEIRKQGFTDEFKLAAWHNQMRGIFPDTRPGTRLTGVYVPKKGTWFFHEGEAVGAITDPDFGLRFFGIWLAEGTSEPQLRRELLSLE